MKLRAVHPPHGRPRRGADRARSRPLRQDLRPLRRAGRRRRSGRPGRGARRRPQRRARHPLRRAGRIRRCAAGRPDDNRRRVRPTGSPTPLAELATLPEVRLLPRTTAFGYYDHNYVCAGRAQRRSPAAGRQALYEQRLWKVRAEQVVLATGAIERPLVFADNDRPGIMLAGAGADLRQPLRRAARQARRRHDQQRQRLSRGHRSGAGGRNRRRHRRSPRQSPMAP